MQRLIVDIESVGKARELQSVLSDLNFVKGVFVLDNAEDDNDVSTKAGMMLSENSLKEEWESENDAHWDSFKAL